MYNEWTVHEYKCLFLTFVFLQIEREKERESGIYKIWVYRRNSPKVTYLIFRRGSTGESFFFHGRIDFELFLTLAWRTRVPRISDILLSSTRNTGFDSSARYKPCQTTDFLIIYFRWRGRSPYFCFGVPANHLASLFSLSGVRQPEVTKYQHLLISPLWPTFFLNGHFFEGLPLFIPTGG